ncbi:MAG: hypothetical protein JWM71_1244 [Solirubrobacteraceae bacterium]|nr:hypothetical protein [Solirubrobacteraceae bacterium]
MRRHLTYANAMATFAVFVALGGASYAALKLPANSVGARQLKKSAVTTAKVTDGSLLAQDFKAGQLPAGAQGAKGDTGASGPAGTPGTAGAQGIAGVAGADGDPAVLGRTRLDFNTGSSDLTSTVAFVKLRDIGQFTKQQADTAVRIIVQDDDSVISGNTCVMQIRVDDKTDAGSSSTAISNRTGTEAIMGNGGAATAPIPWTAVGEFTGLSAGQHTAQLWGYVSGGTCHENAGVFAHTALVDETR